MLPRGRQRNVVSTKGNALRPYDQNPQITRRSLLRCRERYRANAMSGKNSL
jgi:hypothetical protein